MRHASIKIPLTRCLLVNVQKTKLMYIFAVILAIISCAYSLMGWILVHQINIASSNGLVSSDNKPLTKPMLTQMHVTLWHH